MCDESFDSAVKYVAETTTMKATDEQKLLFYKYFKQATVGDCNTSKPGFMDFKGKAKWESWNSAKGMSKEEAKRSYVELLTQLEPNWKSA
uniref:Acyl-coa-binding protein, putative n=1 Tax=Theileria annulata TaxID=5874 RepID=A0A3B0N2H7_THEAN